MRKFSIPFALFFFSAILSFAQQNGLTYSTTTFNIPLAATFDMSEKTIDFDPKLLLVKAAFPSPINEVKQKKIQLDSLRNIYLSKQIKNSNPFYQKTAAATPTLSTNFIGNVTQGTPNDNDIAVSNGGKIISVANTNLFMYNDSGTTVGSKNLATFANKLGSLNRTFDPRVIYDRKKDRFIVVFLQGSTSVDTRIIVAFSQSNDPMLKWNFYVIPGNITNDSSSWSDYPILALSDDDLFITVNRVRDNTPWQTGFIESYIWQVTKQNGYDSVANLAPKVYHDIKYNGKAIWNICPAKGGTTTHGPNMFLVSLRPSDLQNDTVFLHEITNSLSSGNAQLTTKVLRTDKKYGLMPNAIQPSGKKLQTNDARVLSACYEQDWVYYVANTIDTVKFTPAVYFGRIMNTNTSTPTIHGTIISSDTLDFGYPSIAYAGGGIDDRSVMINYSYVSNTQFPGGAVTYCDRNGNLSPMFIYKKGETSVAILADSVERWGDYTGIQRKYNDSAYCWVNSSFGYQNGNRTWIAKIKNNDAKLAVSEIQNELFNSKIYPNPTADYLSVDFELKENTMLEFDMMDLNGKQVASLLRDKGKAGLNRFTFRVNDLKEGIYFLTISNGTNVIQSKKIIVGH
ncbi:MAG: T9SS type A sorting domain-containing protein [Bacteroidota bacterium]